MSFIVPEQTQSTSKATRLTVPVDPKRGVEVTISKLEHFPATGNQLEKAILTVENSEGLTHSHDFVAPTEKQMGIRTTEIINLSKEAGIVLPAKTDFTSYQEFCEYYLLQAIKKTGRWKLVYSKNEVVFNPTDPKNVDIAEKGLDEIKRLRKPYPKSGKMPYFFATGNDKDFTIVSKGDQWDDFVDYEVKIVTPDTEFGGTVTAPDDMPF